MVGDGGGKHSDITKNKISEKAKKQINFNTKKMIEWNKDNDGPKNKIKFTGTQINKIFLLRLRGKTTQDIGLIFNVNRNVIKRIIRNVYINGISLNSPYFLDYIIRLKLVKQVKELYASGESINNIKKILKLKSVKCIRKIIKEYKLCKKK